MKNIKTPIKNDPVAIFWSAFKRIYTDKSVIVFYQPLKDGKKGVTFENDIGGGRKRYTVLLESDNTILGIAEAFLHELTHIGAGLSHHHDYTFQLVEDRILDEYKKISEERFGDAEDASEFGLADSE